MSLLPRHHHGDFLGAFRVGLDQHPLGVLLPVGHWRAPDCAVLARGALLLLLLRPDYLLFNASGRMTRGDIVSLLPVILLACSSIFGLYLEC